jgi:hypothetical protein
MKFESKTILGVYYEITRLISATYMIQKRIHPVKPHTRVIHSLCASKEIT